MRPSPREKTRPNSPPYIYSQHLQTLPAATTKSWPHPHCTVSSPVHFPPNSSGVQIGEARATGFGENPLRISMQQSGAQIAAEHAEPPDGGEDRLSALPDEVLVLILECLDTTAEAVRTSVLARRWPRLWPLLTKLHFELSPDGNRIRELLDVPDAPELHCISVTTLRAAADSVTAWLPAAARRLAGDLVYHNNLCYPGIKSDAEEGRALMRGEVQLPCFEKAITVELHLSFLGLALPCLGVFTRLTNLSLKFFRFCGPCELGDVLSSPRCPCLRKLSICSALELSNLSIYSESLLQMELRSSHVLQLTVVTPILQKLSLEGFFYTDDDLGELVANANITAPQIVSLVWMDQYDPQYFHLGNLERLQDLHTGCIRAYGYEFGREDNEPCLRLLQQFQVLYSLRLELVYEKDMLYYCQYLLGDMTLPQIMFLQLELCNEGHAFGACLFHLLGMCIGLKRLSLVLSTKNSVSFEQEFSCLSYCICDQPKTWRTDELVLDHLEDVHIIGLQGAEHEVAFVQRLLSWATVLKSLRITLHSEMTEGKIEEFREALAGFFRPETCVQFGTSDKK